MKEPKQTGTKTVTIDGKTYTVRVFGETPEDIAKSKKRDKNKRNRVGRSQQVPEVDEANWSIEDRSGNVELPSRSFGRRHVRSGYWKGSGTQRRMNPTSTYWSLEPQALLVH